MSTTRRPRPRTFEFEKEAGGKRIYYGSSYKKGYDIVLGCADVMEFLASVPSNSSSLVVTSPPYNIGKSYEKRMKFEDYLSWQRKVIKECIRTLKATGSICWETGNYVEKGEVHPLDVYFTGIFKEFGLISKKRVIWRIGHGLHARRRFSGRYETISWYTKGHKHTLNLDRNRVPRKVTPEAWQRVLDDWDEEIWDVPNVKANHPEKTIHPCQFPIELVERLILALTNENDVVLDPFAGVG